MPRETSSPPASIAVIGTAIATFAFFDFLIAGVPVAALAAWLDPVVVFCLATVALTVFTVGCCNWVEHRWATRLAGNVPRVEARLERMRRGRFMRHPVAWITRGSDLWYSFAAIFANAIIVCAIARLITGEPAPERRIVLGAFAYAVCFAATFSFTGFVLSDVVTGWI